MTDLIGGKAPVLMRPGSTGLRNLMQYPDLQPLQSSLAPRLHLALLLLRTEEVSGPGRRGM